MAFENLPWAALGRLLHFSSRFIELALILWRVGGRVLPPSRSGLSAQDLAGHRNPSNSSGPPLPYRPGSRGRPKLGPSSSRRPPTGPCARWGFGPSHCCCVELRHKQVLLSPHDKRKKGGHGRRINLSPAQTTHLLVVLISCLSLLWFLLLSFLLSLVRAEDIGSGCTGNSQSRDTSLPPFPFFFRPLATVGHNHRYFCSPLYKSSSIKRE